MNENETNKGLSWIWREAAGVIFIFIATFLTLSLIRYSPDDPGFGTAGAGMPVSNLGGVVGAVLGDMMVQLIGFAAFVFPAVMLMAGVMIIRSHKVKHLWIKLIGFAVLVISLASFLDLLLGQKQAFGGDIASGGVLGSLIAVGLMGLFNKIGAGVIIFMMLSLALMVTTGGSVVAASSWTAGALAKTGAGLNTFFTTVRERAARRKEVAAMREKEASTKPPTIAEKPIPPPPTPGGALKIRERKKARQENFEFIELDGAGYELPSLDLLDDPPFSNTTVDKDSIMMNARILKKKLEDYGVEGEVVEVHPGPVITSYEFSPAAGVKVQKIVNLSDDLSLALSAINVRIVAPIPGKSVVGIEIPNKIRESIFLKEIIGSEAFASHPSMLAMGLGKNTEGEQVVVDLKKMPHLLVAGATGSGKSVALTAMITSILFKSTPEEVRFLMVDMKRLELGAYDGIPHLLHGVITSAKEAAAALKWAVREMEERYRLMAESGVRNVDGYNRKVRKELEALKKGKKKKAPKSEKGNGDGSSTGNEERPLRTLPYVVIIIDELADLMMIAAREVEESIARLAQMARAAGIHLILATQRPSVDVLTGLIKANFPARISFQVAQKVDSRTILDCQGAERLLGAGDMLLLLGGTHKLQRIHGAYVSDDERHRVIDFLKETGAPQYDASIVVHHDDGPGGSLDEEYDERYDEAVGVVTQTGQASISMLQRRMRVGYNRAARMIERMEIEGIVGPSDGVKPREVLLDRIHAGE